MLQTQEDSKEESGGSGGGERVVETQRHQEVGLFPDHQPPTKWDHLFVPSKNRLWGLRVLPAGAGPPTMGTHVAPATLKTETGMSLRFC